MKLTDYVQAQMFDPRKNLFQQWWVLFWGVWAFLVKPEKFYVAGVDEPIELDTGSGQLLRVFFGLSVMVVGLAQVVLSVLASAWLVTLLLLSPLLLVLMRLTAWVLAKRILRRRAKLLAKAREELRQS